MLNTEFLLTSLVVVLIPGTGVIYTISTGLTQHWKASIAAAFGCTAGILPHLTASILGLSAILHMSARVFQVLKYVGVLYLLYLAWTMWRDKSAFRFDSKRNKNNAFQIAFKGIMINLLNPKLTIFFFAFLPQFISAEAASTTSQMIGLSAVFMAMTFVVFVLYGIFASSVGSYLMKSSQVIKYVQRSFAAIFAFMAVKLAFSEQ
ncbi:MAG: LysE family translocator [Anaerolineaceae bacterium]|nr:LysE family translocator [Anaerolineaceae bacterium]